MKCYSCLFQAYDDNKPPFTGGLATYTINGTSFCEYHASQQVINGIKTRDEFLNG